jgi:A118 family predicted phage portal protein
MIGKNTIKNVIGAEPLISNDMVQAIEKWGQIFENKSPWLTKDIKSLNLGATISAEMARSVTIEMKSEITGSTRADFLNQNYKTLIDEMQQKIEYGLAKGGMILKPYVVNGIIAIDYVQADSFYPLSFDSKGEITSAMFVEQVTKNNKIYTRLEYHKFENNSEYITHRAFVSANASTLGNEAPLSIIPEWEFLTPEITITNIKKPLYAYFKVPFANQIDTTSPLGVSIYSRSVDLIEEADKQYSRFLWEFESGERAVFADATAFKKDSNGNYDLPNKKLYKVLDIGTSEGFFHDYTPTIREENILRGLDAILRRIEDNTGLSRGTLSNPESEARTATELKILKQRSFATVSNIQKSLQNALEHTVYIMDVFATLYKLAPNGSYEVSYYWDDSIINDRDKQFSEYQALEAMGVITKEKLYAWYFGTTEEEAAKQVPKQVDIGGVF